MFAALLLASSAPSSQMDYNLTRLMGSDWRDVMEGDFLAAAKDVNDGYMPGERALFFCVCVWGGGGIKGMETEEQCLHMCLRGS